MTDLPQTTPPPPSPSLTWLDLESAAPRCGKSVGQLRRLAGDRWLAEGKARLTQVPGKRAFWEIRSDADPRLTAAATGAAVNVGPPLDLRQYPKAVLDRAIQRKAILDRWDQAVAGGVAMGLSRDDATNAFLALLARENAGGGGGEPVSRITLYRWQSRYRQEQLPGLIDGRALHAIKTKTAAGEDPFLEEVKSLWLAQQKPSVAICHKMALLRANQMGWQPHSYRTAKRFIEAFEKSSPATVLQLRHGSEAFNNEFARHITRDYSTLESNEIWNADHHQLDVIVRVGSKLNPNTGEQEPVHARPWLTAWQDARSRKIVGWIIRAQDPNTAVILEALRAACLSHGVPALAYTDNGKDFDSQALTGETKSMRWKRRRVHVEHDQKKLGGVYAALAIDHLHAWPYHGQSKPIERFFGTLEGSFGKTFDTYCGANAQERPEQLPDMIRRGRAPDLQAFIEQFATWIEVGYHQEPHRGDSMDGQRPAVVWEQNLRTKRTAEKEVLELLLQPRIGPLKVGQNGIVHKGIWYGQYDLAHWFGHDVFITFEANAVRQVSVWANDGRFLCIAKANLRTAFNATPEILDKVIAEQRRENKVHREAARLKPRRYQDRTDRLNEASALAAQQLAAPPIDPTPPTISPIRSDVEGQLPAIRAGFEIPLKKAVGDDTPSPGFLYQRPDTDQTDEGSGMSFTYHSSLEEQP